MVIRRISLREQVKDEILTRLSAGKLEPGASINEVQLAGELNISRTPLREALIALQRDGVIVSEAGKGFSWAPVSLREFSETVPIIVALEVLALSETPVEALTKVAPELLTKARAFRDGMAVHSTVISADDAWHGIFLDMCPNHRLVELIQREKTVLHRYERLVVRDDAVIHRVAQEHELIAQRLLEGDRESAVDALKANWFNSRERLVGQLEDRID
jgi:DNA-binding GntR family transcriptional regulator